MEARFTSTPKYRDCVGYGYIIGRDEAVRERAYADVEAFINSVWGLALPLHHVGGLGVLARAYDIGCELEIFDQPWQEHDFVRWLETFEVTHTSLVPTQVYDLVAADL